MSVLIIPSVIEIPSVIDKGTKNVCHQNGDTNKKQNQNKIDTIPANI